ncbi:hypothetical protein STIAU_1033 [Stigmatella aurantiaca DW4/3-1]|uniref:Uncharacterized protein n=1 Tax=Stigmatella aurantiaca (strain DW4/3-1) TaxID=378806 RepID=Q092X0_STIAD|nr:hypothetical protein STIAU_1033 [Stigmatella aurantiaca DW4/3-1]
MSRLNNAFAALALMTGLAGGTALARMRTKSRCSPRRRSPCSRRSSWPSSTREARPSKPPSTMTASSRSTRSASSRTTASTTSGSTGWRARCWAPVRTGSTEPRRRAGPEGHGPRLAPPAASVGEWLAHFADRGRRADGGVCAPGPDRARAARRPCPGRPGRPAHGDRRPLRRAGHRPDAAEARWADPAADAARGAHPDAHAVSHRHGQHR